MAREKNVFLILSSETTSMNIPVKIRVYLLPT
jgi:hypothetical protein